MLIYQKKVLYRGKEVPLYKLKPNSEKKIEIICPECGTVFKRYFKVLRKSGCFLCQKCALKDKFGKAIAPGIRNNRLTVLRKGKKSGHSVFKCDCGTEKEISNDLFLRGSTKSCGCLRRENIKRVAFHPVGKAHHNWQGGITGERLSIMAKAAYKEWRLSVYKKDNYTCLKCNQKGRELNAHHVENYADNKDKVCCVENGATLCATCHILFHKIYGKKNNTQEQLDEFLSQS
jgi:hypothetical protein